MLEQSVLIKSELFKLEMSWHKVCYNFCIKTPFPLKACCKSIRVERIKEINYAEYAKELCATFNYLNWQWYSFYVICVSDCQAEEKKTQTFFFHLPLCRFPFSIRRASSRSLGTKRHKAVMICTKPDVGPPWVHKAL